MARSAGKPRSRKGLRVDLWLKGRQREIVEAEASARAQGMTAVLNAIVHEWAQSQRQQRGAEYRRLMLEDLMLLQSAEQQLRVVNGRGREELRHQSDDAAQRIRSRIAMIAAL